MVPFLNQQNYLLRCLIFGCTIFFLDGGEHRMQQYFQYMVLNKFAIASPVAAMKQSINGTPIRAKTIVMSFP